MKPVKDQIDMVTACGNIVNYLNPSLTTVDPEDIRIHTGNICRYNGALYWPLVKHLHLCTKLATNQMASHMKQYNTPLDPLDFIIQGAFCASHDFHEIYCTDVVSGLKKYLPNYQRIESIWETYVHNQLGLPWSYANKEFVKHVDVRALVIEMTCLNHPAAPSIAEKYGGKATGNEMLIWKRVADCSLVDNWLTVWNAFQDGRRAQYRKLGYKVELF